MNHVFACVTTLSTAFLLSSCKAHRASVDSSEIRSSTGSSQQFEISDPESGTLITLFGHTSEGRLDGYVSCSSLKWNNAFVSGKCTFIEANDTTAERAKTIEDGRVSDVVRATKAMQGEDSVQASIKCSVLGYRTKCRAQKIVGSTMGSLSEGLPLEGWMGFGLVKHYDLEFSESGEYEIETSGDSRMEFGIFEVRPSIANQGFDYNLVASTDYRFDQPNLKLGAGLSTEKKYRLVMQSDSFASDKTTKVTLRRKQ